MTSSMVRAAGLVGILVLGGATSASAQAPGDSMTCRLFPLACPGPVPPMPPPLLGTPEEQAAVPPPPAEARAGHRKARKAHGHAKAAPAQ